MMNNPLLQTNPLRFVDLIQPGHIQPAITQLLADAESARQTVTQADFVADWHGIGRVLDVATERLGQAWGVVNHLNHVADSPALREAYNATLPLVSAFSTRLGADEALYSKYKAIKANPAESANALPRAALRALELAKRNFVLSGVDLQGGAKEQFIQIQERLSAVGQKFSENVLDATEQFEYLASSQEVMGLPADVLATAQQAAQAKQLDGYLLTLKMPCYLPVMQLAQHRPLRETMYRAYVTRASDQSAPQAKGYDNAPVIEEILALRAQEARLLGFANYTALSLATKMAESGAQVAHFLRELASYARPFAERDVAEMRDFARLHLGLDDPQAWDWPFIGERLKEALYEFNDQEVKQYFTAPKVLAGLFELLEKCFSVRIVADTAPIWHTDVRYYRIEDARGLVGHFYLDPTARSGKQGGAWMDGATSRWLRPDTAQLQTPVAHMVCNFAASVEGRPALLTHDDVITLFHEFGHAMHHLLTEVNEHDVAGINGVEWDAVELPSQMMENFCWEWDVVQALSGHVQTGEPLPRELFDKMLAAKNFQSGLQTLRQVEFALFDLMLHEASPPINPQQLLDQVRAEVAVLPVPAWHRGANTFSHIFAGGYAAGYYSYKWAEVLSSDAYALFEEAKAYSDNPLGEIGQRFKSEFLQMGASRPAMASFVAFRGRKPDIQALLRHQGLQPLASG